MASKTKIIGLTGGIASGKSSVAEVLRKRGIPVLDADRIAFELSQKTGEAYPKIVSQFGKEILQKNGELDRGKLRALVFKDPALRRTLESVLHPLIQNKSETFFKEQAALGAKLVVYEASLLFEAGRAGDFDGILLVTAPELDQVRRLKARDNSLSEETIQGILSSQMPQAKKRELATWVLENSGTLSELEQKVELWLQSVSVAN